MTFMLLHKDEGPVHGDLFLDGNQVAGMRAMLQSMGHKTSLFTDLTPLEPRDEINVICSEVDILNQWWRQPNAQEVYQDLEWSELPEDVFHSLEDLVPNTKGFTPCKQDKLHG